MVAAHLVLTQCEGAPREAKMIVMLLSEDRSNIVRLLCVQDDLTMLAPRQNVGIGLLTHHAMYRYWP